MFLSLTIGNLILYLSKLQVEYGMGLSAVVLFALCVAKTECLLQVLPLHSSMRGT